MANPYMVDIPEGVWTKINTAGPTRAMTVHKQRKALVAYFHNYRDSGDPAPVIGDADEILWDYHELEFTSTVDSDVYLLCRGDDGRVRVEA